MKLGVIGADSSHLPEFSRRIKEMHDAGKTEVRVTHLWTDGEHDWPVAEDVEKWISDAADLGVERVGDLPAMLDAVDGVLVLAVNGHKHLRFATPSLERGLPTYIDKPMTCDGDQARAILEVARAGNARCYSASSLRFATELAALDRDALGRLVAIDATGPGELNPAMEGLYHYDVHTIEMVDAIWGPGVKRVSAVEFEDRPLVALDYADGRYARLRLDRKGSYDFAATVHGEKAMTQFKVDFGPVYTRLVEGMVRFFEGGTAPVELRDIVENVLVMEAGNRSIREDGAWVSIEAPQ